MNGKPWTVSGWFIDRLKELIHQSFSTAYLIAFALTVNFLIRNDAITRDAMLAAWTLAFGVRFVAAPLAEAGAAKIQPTVPKEPMPPTPAKVGP